MFLSLDPNRDGDEGSINLGSLLLPLRVFNWPAKADRFYFSSRHRGVSGASAAEPDCGQDARRNQGPGEARSGYFGQWHGDSEERSLLGEVVASAAKTKSAPSRLAIRMNSVQWKNGSAAVKIYLTAWYYPARDAMGQDLQYGPQEPANRTWNGQGQYPDPNSKSYKPFPGSDSGKDSAVPDTPSAAASNHRVLMKDVEYANGTDGSLALVCKRTNIKLDKLTTYVLSSGDLLPAK